MPWCWPGSRQPGQPAAHGALGLARLPRVVTVDDQDRCALPQDSRLWPSVASACFQHHGRPVPVVDPLRLFAAVA
ncbi:hypothetical protein [Ramlibacter tataouinensis]|uniref:hypothetical protein n=1 Tax=Ramlibacter tataouinensis TaxID=94132 RepID=UPI0005A28FAA|nr:hypothetical protein [Ramlibacter tataouinensis]